MFGIETVVPLLLEARGPDLCGVSDPQFEAQLGQSALGPTGVSRRFDPHSHLDSFLLQLTVELSASLSLCISRFSPHSPVSVSAQAICVC